MNVNWKNKKTFTPDQDWEKFKIIHTGKNRTKHWIKQYGLVLEKYPYMRIYSWHKAVKWYCEYNGIEYIRPRFQPDLYLVCSEYIVCFEIEHTSRWSKSKQHYMMDWYIEMDAQECIRFYIYRFDGYGNYQDVIFPNAEEQFKKLNECPIEHREWFEGVTLDLLHAEQETLLNLNQ